MWISLFNSFIYENFVLCEVDPHAVFLFIYMCVYLFSCTHVRVYLMLFCEYGWLSDFVLSFGGRRRHVI